jgi:PAS domain-containing protein
MDGVRKKAKYLHDAPDGALMPGVGGHYPFMNGNRPTPLPTHDTQAVSMAQPGNHYTQPAYYSPSSAPGGLPHSHDARNFSQPSPISPPYNQPHSNAPAIPQTQPAQLQQFGGPLFDPSDPALFNFDISSLNFGNHYGALEFGMLGHMSSGAAETPPADPNIMGHMNNMYNPQMPGYVEQSPALPFGPDGLPTGEWQGPHSRNGSMQVQTPHSTPATAPPDQHNHRHDSLNGPHAFAIGQGPGSHHTESPASTDANSAYDNENPMTSVTFFANTNQPHNQVQRSPVSRRDNRQTNALQPVQSNGVRKRHRDTKSIYQGITKPYDYVRGYHKLFQMILTKYSKPWAAKAQEYLQNFRGVLLGVHQELDREDLIHQEKNLQRNLVTLQEHFTEIGTPFIICRRSGEIVAMNKEFTILTGWKREVLLGQEPNLTVNHHGNRDPNESELSTQTNTTPTIAAQEAEAGPQPVNIIQLLDPKSALQYLQRFSELAYQDARGSGQQRVNMLRYQTKADVERLHELKAGKPEPIVKTEGGSVHQGEHAMQRLGAKNGMVDCMIWWHVKRDIFDMPVLVCISVSLYGVWCEERVLTDAGDARVGQGTALNRVLGTWRL